MTTVAGAAEGLPCDVNRVGASVASDGQQAPEMSHSTQCRTWTTRLAGTTSLSESPGMTAIPALTRRSSRPQPAGQVNDPRDIWLPASG
jgi:hypothetical protein